ncbi:MAG: radical SAM protein [Xanthobacteraceae bacterium]
MSGIKPQLDIFVRRGFGAGDLVRLPPSQEAGIGIIEEWQLGRSLRSLDYRQVPGSGSHVAFIDAAVGFDLSHWPQILEELADQHNFAALTFQCSALLNVFNTGNEHSATLPSWFSVVEREAFERAASEYQTLEFALLELVAQSGKDGRLIRFVDKAFPSFDHRSWASDVVFRCIDELGADYSTFKRRYGESAPGVPAQFRIGTQSRFHTDRLSTIEDQKQYPKFSVICPVFKPDFLHATISSVRDQAWPHWELLLLVDGPPPAATVEIEAILHQFCDPRIKYWFRQNQGTGPSRRELALAASGDYIVTIDDDDMLTPLTLSVFASAIRTNGNPGPACIRGGAQIFGLVEEYLPPRKRMLIDGIPNDPFEVTQPYAISRRALEQIGGYEWDETLHRAGEDTILFHKLDAAGMHTLLIDKPLYMRRLSTKNLSLFFKYNEAMGHFKNLDERFSPNHWQVVDRRFQMLGNFQRANVVYAHRASPAEVVCSTRFFQYQTLGDLSDVTIDLEVTSVCNASCGFCPRHEMPDKKTFISMDLVAKIANEIRGESRPRQVVLCGVGESMLHPHLNEIVRTLSEAGASVAMTTNGERLTPQRFRELVALGLQSVNFSLNAATPETHRKVMVLKSYRRIVDQVEEILALRCESYPKVRAHVSFVVCDLNEHEVQEFVEYWRLRQPSQIWLHPVNNRAGLVRGRNAANLERFSRTYRGDPMVSVDIFRNHPEEHNLCKIARSLMFVSADGEMRLCAMDYRRTTSYGNIRSKTLRQMHFEKLLAYVRGQSDDFCAGCDFKPGVKSARPSGEISVEVK